MNKNKFITGKKAVALLSAIGVTATLLSPLALNTKVFANDETPQIASRTPGDASDSPLVSVASYSDYHMVVNYKDYNDKQRFLNALKDTVLNFDHDKYMDINIVFPVGFSLNKNNVVDKEIYDIILDNKVLTGDPSLFINSISHFVWIGDDIDSKQYSINLESINWNSDSIISFPDVKTFLKSNESVKKLFKEGTNIFLFDLDKISNYFNCSNDVEHFMWINARSLLNTQTAYYFLMNSTLTELKSSNIWYPERDYDAILEKESITIIADQILSGYEYSTNSSYATTFDATDPSLLEYLERVYFKSDATDIKYNKNAKYLPAAVFEIAKQYNKPISLTFTDDDGKLEYSLTISEIKEIKDLNVQLTIKKLEGTDTPQFEFDFAHSGTLPGPMTVRAFVGYEYNAKTAYLYYKNADGQLEKQPSAAKVEAGYAEFVIDHCSTYVVSLEEIEGAIDNTQSTTPESDTEISTTPSVDSTTETDSNNNSSTGSTTGDTSTSGNTTTKEDTTVNLTNQDSPSTGDTTKTTVLLSTMVLAGVVIVTFVLRKKVKRS